MWMDLKRLTLALCLALVPFKYRFICPDK